MGFERLRVNVYKGQVLYLYIVLPQRTRSPSAGSGYKSTERKIFEGARGKRQEAIGRE
jgi:hypothetical protein